MKTTQEKMLEVKSKFSNIMAQQILGKIKGLFTLLIKFQMKDLVPQLT